MAMCYQNRSARSSSNNAVESGATLSPYRSFSLARHRAANAFMSGLAGLCTFLRAGLLALGGAVAGRGFVSVAMRL